MIRSSKRRPFAASLKRALLLALWGAALVALAMGTGGCRGRSGRPSPAASVEYYCPMHPSFMAEAPGDCSICGMKLVTRPRHSRISRAPAAAKASGEGGAAAATGTAASGALSDEDQPVADRLPGAPAGATVAGRATVVLHEASRRLLGVRSERVRRLRLFRQIRALGRVATDESRVYPVRAGCDVRVERVYVDTGRQVSRGQPLLSISGPGVSAAQEEYRAGAGGPEPGGSQLRGAGGRRSFSCGLTGEDLPSLAPTEAPRPALDLKAQRSGYLVRVLAAAGASVALGAELCAIGDFSRVLVLADIYESDLPSVKVGMAAVLTVLYLPGKAWTGRVVEVAPTLEGRSRTITVRIEAENPDGELKPGMFADVLLKRDLGLGLLVPESAVIFSGNRRLAFVDNPDGRLEPRELRIGPNVGGGFQVLNGLAEGERVVTSANFLIDSEASLRGAVWSLSSSAAGAGAAEEP